MATLGIVFIWFGYTSIVGGLAKIKAAYGAQPALTISDLALPSHRATYLAAWTGASASSSTTPNSPPGSGASSPVPGKAPAATGPNTVFGAPPGIPSPVPPTSGPFVPAT